jgi:hypothetical protein
MDLAPLATIGTFMDREVLALLGLDPLRHQAVLCHVCGVAAD